MKSKKFTRSLSESTPVEGFDLGFTKEEKFSQLYQKRQGCTLCFLSQKRTNLVFGEGNLYADLVLVGEGPGEQEDLSGRPFVGPAGLLLEKMLNAIGLKREDVFICNVVKCRPPLNRNPEPDEVEKCSPFLLEQINLIQPKIILALGKFAAQTLTQSTLPISRLRGSFYPFGDARLLPTFHPSYLLRNPEAKKEAWEDLKKVAFELGISLPQRKN